MNRIIIYILLLYSFLSFNIHLFVENKKLDELFIQLGFFKYIFYASDFAG